jgi:hypothetical protein
VSWTLASLLTPLVFLASFVRPNHSATSRPGIIVSPQRLRHITAAGDASKERAPSLANADSVVNGGNCTTGCTFKYWIILCNPWLSGLACYSLTFQLSFYPF